MPVPRSRLLWLALAALPGCFLLYPKSGPPPGMPSPEAVAAAKTRWSQVVPDSIATGRQLYLAKCNYCHDYPDVRAIDRNDWPDIMRKMGPKSNLDPAQTQAVLSFILAAVSQP